MANGDIEIDVRQVIHTLLAYRFWIIGAALFVGLVVFGISILQPKLYKATAVVSINSQDFRPNFVANYQNVFPTLTNSLVMDIAKSDEITFSVFEKWTDSKKDAAKFRNFVESSLFIEQGKNASVVYLSVKLESEEAASKLVNYWAQQVVDKINTQFSNYSQEDLLFFENQVATSTQNMQVAEQALIDFEKINESGSLTNQLNGLFEQQRDSLKRLRLINYLQRDMQTFLDQFINLSDTAPLPAGDYLKLMVLQLRLYGDSTATNLSTIQLQLTGMDGAGPKTVGEARSSLRELQVALKSQTSELMTFLAEYPQNVTDLQRQIEILNQKEARLKLEKQLAQNEYSTMKTKMGEVRIGIPDSSNFSNITSLSVPPLQKEDSNTVRNTSIGIIIGALIMFIGVLSREWWLKGEKSDAKPSE